MAKITYKQVVGFVAQDIMASVHDGENIDSAIETYMVSLSTSVRQSSVIEVEGMLQQLAGRLKGIDQKDMSPTEKQVATLLKKQCFLPST